MSEKDQSSFSVLSSVNVEGFVRGKNGFKYLSWAHAVQELQQRFPQATWEHREWNGLPFLKTSAGCFVEMSLTINGITRKQLHPILDYRNQPILEPNAFQVNTSLQRALAKVIALHGLGLYVYAGEDLPPSEQEALQQARLELIDLLKAHSKYDNNNAKIVNNMNYENIMERISFYRSKGAQNA